MVYSLRGQVARRVAVTYFSGSIKLIWIFNTYISAPKVRPLVVGAEKVTRKGNLSRHPVYDVLKNPSPTTRKICADRTRLFGVQRKCRQ